MKFIFWFSLFMILYAYFGYAIALWLIDVYQRLFKGKRFSALSESPQILQSEESLPRVSFIITAYNEEQRITQKIENSIAQDYPAGRLEIIIASDCSSDRTDEIVLNNADKGIKLVRAPERKGKENAQMHAVQAATGDILVFSDVATILKPDAIQLIVRNFQEPTIGCVSSEDRFIDRDGKVSGEGLYVKYEMFIRKLESRVNSLVGLSGSFFAARRDVCRDWAPDLQSDFSTLLNSVKLGLKGISDPNSIGYYENIADERKEFQRKVRTVLRGITVFMRYLHLLNPKAYGIFAWQLFSHKLCRWLVPIFLVIVIATNTALIDRSFLYVLTLIVQISFYAAAAIHSVNAHKAVTHFEAFKEQSNTSSVKESAVDSIVKQTLVKIARISYYFVSVNVSILFAWFKYFSGERATLWEPSKR